MPRRRSRPSRRAAFLTVVRSLAGFSGLLTEAEAYGGRAARAFAEGGGSRGRGDLAEERNRPSLQRRLNTELYARIGRPNRLLLNCCRVRADHLASVSRIVANSSRLNVTCWAS